jgi:hypothetical protein
MKRELLTLAIGCLGLATASAQYNPYGGGYELPGPWQPYSPYTQQGMAPNPYNRGTQPLSPYLNLLRGTGNPAVDYYFGVRPGTPAGQPLGQQPWMGGPGNTMMNSQMRQGYIPQAGTPNFEPQQLPDAGKPVVLPASGHGVGYGNVFGISRTGVPGMNGGGSRNGFFQAPTTGTVQQGAAPKR